MPAPRRHAPRGLAVTCHDATGAPVMAQGTPDRCMIYSPPGGHASHVFPVDGLHRGAHSSERQVPLISRRRGSAKHPSRLLIIMLGDAGDILLATPALRAVRHSFPRAHITLLTKPTTCHVLEDQGLIDQIIPFDKHLFDDPRSLMRPRALGAALRFLWEVRRQHADTALLLHHLTLGFGALKFAVLLLSCGARRRAGLDNGHGWFLTHRVPDQGFGPHHQVRYWLDVAAQVGALPAPGDHLLPAYRLPATAHQELSALLACHDVPRDQGLLVLHAGSGAYSAARRWPAERFAAVAAALQQHDALFPVLVGGSDERAIVEQVARLIPGPSLCLAGHTNWPQLGALLASARLVIANDGGVAHLAAAVGAPLVTIFGPSNSAAWRPLGPRTHIVHATLPCMPCFYRGHTLGNPRGCPPRTCLQLVTPEMVLAAGRALLPRDGHEQVNP